MTLIWSSHKFSLLFSIAILLFSDCLPAQSIITINDLRLRHFQLKDGLPSQMVERIIEDKAGFIWIGTYNGLLRYDGYDFQKIVDGKIGAILEDKDGFIWAGTEKDLIRYDPKTASQRSFYYKEKVEKPSNWYDVVALAQDQTGSIIVGTAYDCLIRLTPNGRDSFDISHYPCSYEAKHRKPAVLSDTLAGGWIWNIVTANNGTVWLGTGGSLSQMVIPDLSKPKEVRFKYTIPTFNPYEAQDYFGVSSISKGRDGKLWIIAQHQQGEISQNGLIFLFDPLHENFIQYTSPQKKDIRYRYIQEDKQGNLWNGPSDDGLQFISASDIDTIDATHRQIRRFKRYPFVKSGDISIGTNNVQGFLEDRTASIWVLSNFLGLYQIPRKINAFQHFELPLFTKNDNNGVSDIISEDKDHIWIATWRNGLYKYQLSNGKHTQYLSDRNTTFSPNVFELFRDPKHKLWVLTGNQSIHQLNEITQDFKTYQIITQLDHTPKDVEKSIFFSGISEDNQGNFWFGSNGLGLIHFDPKTKNIIHQFLPKNGKENWIEGSEIMSTICDPEGHIWAGSPYHGLYDITFDEKEGAYRFTRYLQEIPMMHKLFFDREGRFWIGTYAHGLILFDPQKKEIVQQFTAPHKLPNSNIWDIDQDREGNLWIVTSNALVKLNPNTFESTVFGPSYGFDFSQKVHNRLAIDANGRVIFGGEGGFYVFDPNKNNVAQGVIPKIVLSGLIINNDSSILNNSILDSNINFVRSLTLNHNQNNLAISYTGLYPDDPKGLQYSYVLENYHNTWQQVGGQRIARLSNLAPGKYRFRVKVDNDAGSSEEKVLAIHVRSPWWWSWYSKLIYLAASFSLIWAYFSFQNRLLKEQIDKEKIADLSNMRSRFFANISHEFRTPLTLIRGPIEDKLIFTENPQEKKELTKIHDQTSRMLKLVNELLDLSKLDIEKLRLQEKSGEIYSFLRTNIEIFRSASDQRRLQLNIKIPDDQQFVLFDSENLQKVLINLLSNAIKHCPEDGKVEIEAHYDITLSILQLQVKNEGDPIPEEEIGGIFNRFYQASNAKHQGSGVGLALVKELIELMKGTISVSSSFQEGTSFVVAIPMIISTESPAMTPVISRVTAIGNQATGPFTSESSNAEEVLLVEDNPDVRNYLTSILANRYQIIEAKNGKEGYELALLHVPDLVISDVMMPEMDGVELCHKLKADHRTDHIPIILLTAKADTDSRIEGLASGADDYLSKPFNSQELLVRIENLVSQRARLKERFKQSIQVITSDLKIRSADQRFLQQAVEVVKNHLDDTEFDVQIFSAELNLSRTHLHKKLKSIADQSPSEFIRNLRLQHASELLAADFDNVSQIAYAVGFTNLSYFTKCFREKYGMTPTAFGNAGPDLHRESH